MSPFMLAALLMTAGVCASAEDEPPAFDLRNLVQADVAGHGYFANLAQDPRNPDRLLASDGFSRIWMIQNNAPPTLYAGTELAAHKDGNRTAAGFHKPHALCMDPYGFVYVADTGSATIRRINDATGEVTTVAGYPYQKGSQEGAQGRSRLSSPVSLLCLPDGTVLVGDTGTQKLSKLECKAHCPTAPPPSGGGGGGGDGADANEHHSGHHLGRGWKIAIWVMVGASAVTALGVAVTRGTSLMLRRRIQWLHDRHSSSSGQPRGSYERLAAGSAQGDEEEQAPLLLEEAKVEQQEEEGEAKGGEHDLLHLDSPKAVTDPFEQDSLI